MIVIVNWVHYGPKTKAFCVELYLETQRDRHLGNDVLYNKTVKILIVISLLIDCNG